MLALSGQFGLMKLLQHPWTLVLLQSGIFEERIVWAPKKILKVMIFSKTVKGTHDQ